MLDPQLPTLSVVLATALVDSINPCAIGVLVLLISTLLSLAKDRKRMLFIGLVYVVSVYITYFLAGIGLTAVLTSINTNIATWISIIVGGIIILMGFVEIKDFFWYGKGFSLSINPKYAKKIHQMAKNTSVWGVILLGIFVAAVELPCTGGPYLAITLLLSQNFNLQAVYLLGLYNFIFVLPLIVILFAVFFGTKIQHIKAWKQGNRKWMRLSIGLVLVVLGVFLILIALGFFSLGY